MGKLPALSMILRQATKDVLLSNLVQYSDES